MTNSLLSQASGLELAAGGQTTINYGSNILKAVMAVVLALTGLGLIIYGVRDIFIGLKDTNKDWGQVGLGCVTAIVGGLFIGFSVMTAISIFQNMGHDFSPA